jgi:O-antigen/teichoic acid export membrane protein
VGAAIGIVTNGLLARMLSPQELGAYFLAISIVSLGAVIGSLGLSKPAVRFVAEGIGLNRAGRARGAIYAVLMLGVLGALGVGFSYLLVGELVGRYLFDAPALVAVTGLIAGWMALSVVQDLTAETFRGFHDFRMATLLGAQTIGKGGALVMRGLLLGCLVLLLLKSRETDLKTVMLVSIGSGSVGALLSIWLLRTRVSSLDSQGAENYEIGPREALRVSLPILAIDLTAFVLHSADIWILGALGSQEEVAIYGAASRLVAFVAMPLVMVNLVLPPVIAELYAQGKTIRLERTIRAYSTVAGVPSVLVLMIFMLLGGPILGLVYGDYYRSGVAVLMLLSAARVTAVWSGSCGLVLQMTDHQASMLRVSVLTSPLFFVAAILAAQRYGAVGVASAAAITTSLQNLIMVLVAKKKTGMWTHVNLSLSPFRRIISNR